MNRNKTINELIKDGRHNGDDYHNDNNRRNEDEKERSSYDPNNSQLFR